MPTYSSATESAPHAWWKRWKKRAGPEPSPDSVIRQRDVWREFESVLREPFRAPRHRSDAVALQPTIQRPSIEAKHLRRQQLVSPGLFQDIENVFAFERRQRPVGAVAGVV